MKYHKEIILRDGRKCVLRNPTAENAEEIIEHMKITSGETYFMLRYPEELKLSADDEGAFLDNIEKSGDSVMISAIVDGKIVANGGINPVMPFIKCRHRAEFGVSVKKDYWKLGIGSAILEGIIECAKEIGYERIELDVVSENERALALYKKFSFTVFGENKKAFRLKDGTYLPLTLMVLELR